MSFKENKICIDASNSILLHGGGWKKMEHLRVDNDIFKKEVEEYLPGINCKNYYGMIEQTGSVLWNVQKVFFTVIIMEISALEIII